MIRTYRRTAVAAECRSDLDLSSQRKREKLFEALLRQLMVWRNGVQC